MNGCMLLADGSLHVMAKALKDARGTGREMKNLLWSSPDFAAVNSQASQQKKTIAVLPLTGLLEHTQSVYGWLMGGTDMRLWSAAFDNLMAADSVKAIVIAANTPGGTAYGTPETAAKVYAARGKKPLVTVIDPQMASAGYYIGSASEAVFVTPSGEAGSIGTVQIHEDWSKALEAEGVSVDIIKSGANKFEGHPYGPLSEETRQHFQAEVDECNSMFVSSVAKHRNVSASAVRSQFGDGRMFSARSLIDRGMADKIATLEQVVKRLASGRLDASAMSQEEWSSGVMMERPQMRGDDAERLMSIQVR